MTIFALFSTDSHIRNGDYLQTFAIDTKNCNCNRKKQCILDSICECVWLLPKQKKNSVIGDQKSSGSEKNNTFVNDRKLTEEIIIILYILDQNLWSDQTNRIYQYLGFAIWWNNIVCGTHWKLVQSKWIHLQSKFVRFFFVVFVGSVVSKCIVSALFTLLLNIQHTQTGIMKLEFFLILILTNQKASNGEREKNWFRFLLISTTTTSERPSEEKQSMNRFISFYSLFIDDWIRLIGFPSPSSSSSLIVDEIFIINPLQINIINIKQQKQTLVSF